MFTHRAALTANEAMAMVNTPPLLPTSRLHFVHIHIFYSHMTSLYSLEVTFIIAVYLHL